MRTSGLYLMKVLHTQRVMKTRLALLGRMGVSAGVALRQRRQQRLGLLEIGGIKALGEPAVDRQQQRVGFSALAMLLPQARQAHGRTQLPGLGLLATGNIEGLTKAGFCLYVMLCR